MDVQFGVMCPRTMVKKLEATLMGYYRQIHDVGFWKHDHITDDEFRRAQQLPTFRQIWARHKLTFFAACGAIWHSISQGPTFPRVGDKQGVARRDARRTSYGLNSFKTVAL